MGTPGTKAALVAALVVLAAVLIGVLIRSHEAALPHDVPPAASAPASGASS